ncbi:hypothetical protein [Pseudomonas sp. RW3S2]|uniref:hypothetical protein n=1 Tax=Pseudomonas sp. RW3S2 TaxID=485884 RepID=UPI001644CE65|nr:hypothetical protein [Pseudomonas sp. RW3S2]MBC3423608.1 hypothetical protein [Pseudomonas sp. RW3S2]
MVQTSETPFIGFGMAIAQGNVCHSSLGKGVLSNPASAQTPGLLQRCNDPTASLNIIDRLPYQSLVGSGFQQAKPPKTGRSPPETDAPVV